MQHPCKLYREGQAEAERFAAVAFLADRIHALREGRTVRTVAITLTTPGFAGSGVGISFDDEAGGVLGYAIIGEPEYPAERQDQLLHGAIYRLDPIHAPHRDWAA